MTRADVIQTGRLAYATTASWLGQPRGRVNGLATFAVSSAAVTFAAAMEAAVAATLAMVQYFFDEGVDRQNAVFGQWLVLGWLVLPQLLGIA